MTASNEASDLEVRRLGSYTTAKVSAGRVERLERHVARLRRDAARLDLPLPDRTDVERVFVASAQETFGRGDGIVRVEWSHAPGAAPELIAKPRPFNMLPATWRAITSRVVHPGPELRANTKYVDVAAWEPAARDVAFVFQKPKMLVHKASPDTQDLRALLRFLPRLDVLQTSFTD